MRTAAFALEPAGRRSRPPLAWLYPLAWLPYLALYGLALGVAGRLPPGMATLGAVANVLPPALLGPGVLALVRRLPWGGTSRPRFFALHGAALLAFGAASALGSFGIFWLADTLRAGGSPERLASEWRIAAWQFLIAALLYCALASFGYTTRLLGRLRAEEARLARARELQARAELAALRSRLSPHFLFNALHSLLALVRTDAAAAEEGIERLGDLLHYALAAPEREGDEVALGEEWVFTRDYLALESLRLGERLRVEADLPAELAACRVPALCLQPLVENAVRHAVAPRAAGGTVAVRARHEDGALVLEVADDGPGADPTALAGEVGLGLRLVRERLVALYGARAWLAH
ncbi:MAG: sensor histidine kinase, partial [Thermoanaerobaculia bacterium]